MNTFHASIGAIAFLAASAVHASAGVTNESLSLQVSDAASGDFFGAAVAIDGDFLIAGARADDDFGSSSGSATVFRRTAPGVWVQEQKLTASDASGSDQFGWAVDIDGDLAVVNARRDDVGGTNSGSVYIFRRSAMGVWSQVDKIGASDPAQNDEFGSSVSISNGTVIVGASNNDDDGSNSGAVYFFAEESPDDWTQLAKVTAPDAAGGDEFGFGVSIDGDVAAVGAPYSGGFFGSVYIYRQTMPGVWSFEEEVTTPDARSFGEFGFSVSVSGDTLIVGAPSDDEKDIQSGVAYIFTKGMTGWEQAALFTPMNPQSGMFFGESVNIDGGTAVAGGRGGAVGMIMEESPPMSGMWFNLTDIQGSDGDGGSSFGDSVSVSNGTVAAGAPLADNSNSVPSGVAHVFSAPAACVGDCDGSGTVDFNDLIAMLFEFGNSTEACDADNSGTIDFNDLITTLFLFGPC